MPPNLAFAKIVTHHVKYDSRSRTFRRIFREVHRKLSKRTQDAAAQSNGILEEALQGIQNVKAFTNEFFELGRYKISIDEIKRLAIKGAVWRGLFVSFIILCLFGAIVFVIWRGVLLTQTGNLEQASFISFIMYTIFLGAPSIGSLPDLYANIQKAIGATENLMEIVEQEVKGPGKEKKDQRNVFAVKLLLITSSFV